MSLKTAKSDEKRILVGLYTQEKSFCLLAWSSTCCFWWNTPDRWMPVDSDDRRQMVKMGSGEKRTKIISMPKRFRVQWSFCPIRNRLEYLGILRSRIDLQTDHSSYRVIIRNSRGVPGFVADGVRMICECLPAYSFFGIEVTVMKRKRKRATMPGQPPQKRNDGYRGENVCRPAGIWCSTIRRPRQIKGG